MAGSEVQVLPTMMAGIAASRSPSEKSCGRISEAMPQAIGGMQPTTPTMPYQSYTPEATRENEKNHAALLTGPPRSKASMQPTRNAATSLSSEGMAPSMLISALMSQAITGPST